MVHAEREFVRQREPRRKTFHVLPVPDGDRKVPDARRYQLLHRIAASAATVLGMTLLLSAATITGLLLALLVDM